MITVTDATLICRGMQVCFSVSSYNKIIITTNISRLTINNGPL